MKRLFLALMATACLQAADTQVSHYRLFNDKQQELRVAHELTDSVLKQVKPEHMAAFLKGNYIKAHELSDGTYRLEAMGRLNGGGPVGAAIGAWLGWGTVTSVGVAVGSGCAKGGAVVGTLIGGPAGTVVGGAIGTTVGIGLNLVVFKPASLIGGLVGGLIGGAATGPV